MRNPTGEAAVIAAAPPVDRELTRWAAEQVIRQHTEQASIVDADDPASGSRSPYPTHAAGRCAQCTPIGCRMLVWARAELAVLAGKPPDAGQPPRAG